MNMKIIRGTLFGGIAYFLLGGLVWGILLMDFYTANYSQVMNRPETDTIWWAMIVSNLATALLLTLILKWSGAKSIMDGLRTGAIVGFLFSLSIGLSFYSLTTMYNNLSGIVVDLVVNSSVMAVIGLVIVLTWGKEKTT